MGILKTQEPTGENKKTSEGLGIKPEYAERMKVDVMVMYNTYQSVNKTLEEIWEKYESPNELTFAIMILTTVLTRKTAMDQVAKITIF